MKQLLYLKVVEIDLPYTETRQQEFTVKMMHLLQIWKFVCSSQFLCLCASSFWCSTNIIFLIFYAYLQYSPYSFSTISTKTTSNFYSFSSLPPLFLILFGLESMPGYIFVYIGILESWYPNTTFNSSLWIPSIHFYHGDNHDGVESKCFFT